MSAGHDGSRDVAVLGAGMHPWGKWGRPFVSYGVAAARQALADAGVDWADVDLVVGGETVRNGYGGYVAGVPESGDLTTPMVGTRTDLHGHHAGREPAEELQNLGPPERLAEHHPSRRIRPVRLKDQLRQIQTDRGNLAHGRLP